MVLSFCMHSLGMHWHHKVLPVTACHCQEREPGAAHTIKAMPSHKPSCYLSPNLFSWNKPWTHLLWGSAHHPLESSFDSRMRLCLSEEKKVRYPLKRRIYPPREGWCFMCNTGLVVILKSWEAGWSFLTACHALLWAWITFTKCKTFAFIQISQKVSFLYLGLIILLKKDFLHSCALSFQNCLEAFSSHAQKWSWTGTLYFLFSTKLLDLSSPTMHDCLADIWHVFEYCVYCKKQSGGVFLTSLIILEIQREEVLYLPVKP